MIAAVGPPRIIYATFATTRRSGGVHVMSEHVRLLRSIGHQAWLWVPGPDGPPEWFDATVPTMVGPTLELGANDLLVLPEVPVVPGQDAAPGRSLGDFNQNHFYTYAAGPASAWDSYPDWQRQPMVWTVSDESRDVLSAVHPVPRRPGDPQPGGGGPVPASTEPGPQRRLVLAQATPGSQPLAYSAISRRPNGRSCAARHHR